MAAISSAAGGGAWNVTGTWTGGVIPVASDEVTITASSTVSIPAATTVACRKLSLPAASVLVFAATTSTLNIGDATAPTAGAGLSASNSAILTLTGIGTVNFVSTAAGAQNIDFGGSSPTWPNVTFNAGTTTSYTFTRGLVTSGVVTLTQGGIDTNSQTCTWGGFVSSNSNTRSLTLGASVITSSGSGVNSWFIATATGLTVNAGTSSITLSGVSVQFYAGFAWYDVAITGGGGPFVGRSGTTFHNFTVTGTAVASDVLGLRTVDITVSGTLTFTGNSASSRLAIKSQDNAGADAPGVPRTITAAVVVVQNVDFQDITGAGAGWANALQPPLFNALTNPSFETNASAWSRFSSTGSGAGPTAVADGTCIYGTQAGEITNTATLAGSISFYLQPNANPISLTPGDRIGMRMRAKVHLLTTGAATSLNLSFRLCDANNAYITSYRPSTISTTGFVFSPVTGTWYDLYGYVDVNTILAAYPNATTVNVTLDVPFAANTSGLSVRIDAAEFYRMSDVDTVPVPQFDTTLGSTNLITNPKFEVNTTDWATAGANTTATRDTAEAYIGSASCKVITTPATGSAGLTTIKLPLRTPGNVHTASVYVKGDVPSVGTAMRVITRCYDATLTQVFNIQTTFTLTNSWQQVLTQFTPPLGAVTYTTWVLDVGTTAQTYWVDAATVEERATAGLYYDGDTPGYAWSGTANASASVYVSRGVGNALGNSAALALAEPPRTLYARQPSGFNTPGTWALTSGGSAVTETCRPQDDLIFDSNTPIGTYTVNVPRVGRNFTVTGSFAGTITNSIAWAIQGNYKLNSTVVIAGANALQLRGRGTHTITTSGRTITFVMQTYAFGGSYTLADNYNSLSSFQPLYGTFDTAGFNMTLSTFVSNVASIRNIQFRTSTITLTSIGNVWFFTSGTLTVDASTATVNVTNLSATAKTMSLSSSVTTLGTLNFSGAGSLSLGAPTAYGTINSTAPGQSLSFSAGNCTVTNLNVVSGVQILLATTATPTIANYSGSGAQNAYVYMSGGGYASFPGSTPLNITGDLDVRIKVALDSWSSAVTQTLIGRLTPTDRTWMLSQVSGIPFFQYSLDGTSSLGTAATIAPVITDGDPLWVRVTRRASDGRIQYFTASGSLTSPAPGDFTQLGADVAGTSGNLFVPTTFPFYVGVHAQTSSAASGKFYRAQIRNNILDNGTGTVLDADFTTKAFGADSFTGGAGNVITLSGPAVAGDGRIDMRSATPGTQATLICTTSWASSMNGKIIDIKLRGATGRVPGYVNGGNCAGFDFRARPAGLMILG
jgi:hypothetical protein